jgi:transposase
MAKPYSRDLRERMVRAVQAGRSRHEVARMFEVSASCVIKLMRRYETTGDCAPGKFGGHKRSALIGFEDKVRELVAEQPDVTVAELWRKLTALGVKVGRSAVGRFLQRLQLPLKKTGSGRRPACAGGNGLRYREPEGSGRRVFGRADPVKTLGPWAVADLRVVTPTGDPD